MKRNPSTNLMLTGQSTITFHKNQTPDGENDSSWEKCLSLQVLPLYLIFLVKNIVVKVIVINLKYIISQEKAVKIKIDKWPLVTLNQFRLLTLFLFNFLHQFIRSQVFLVKWMGCKKHLKYFQNPYWNNKLLQAT